MDYKTIPLRPETFNELKQIKGEAERKVGTNFDWNSFIIGLILGAGGTALSIAIAEAIKEWRKRREKDTGSQEVKK
ncbi:hypothetical protein E3J84_00290 [Candidatus Aerophobetes bacterium]|uniref:Uncharacterized protein n=1 Tax=Aerophobetes bacterium TaxID=2030807 RepID=A0A523S625_UNCAE|nr:MAG: hypothetical protein E3J84_00290 [Candidatus Aerophobetes bacterium]